MNPIKKILHGLLLVTATLLFLILYDHFNQEKQGALIPAHNTTASVSPYTIGWSVYNSDYEFFQAMEDGVLAEAKDLGIKVITHNQQSSTSEMIAGVSDLISQGIDALVISPFNPDALPVISSLAQNAGIPIIIVDIGTDDSFYDAFIVSDSYGGGVLAAEYALKLLQDKNYTSKNAAIIKTEATAQYANLRGDAFKRVLTDSGYTVVDEIRGDSREDLGYNAMKELLEKYGDNLAVVFSENDRMAIGAANAIKEAGKTGDIILIGFDGDASAVAAIKEGLMQGTIAQRPFEMGALGIETAYKLLRGDPVSFDDRTDKLMLVEVNLIDQNANILPLIP